MEHPSRQPTAWKEVVHSLAGELDGKSVEEALEAGRRYAPQEGIPPAYRDHPCEFFGVYFVDDAGGPRLLHFVVHPSFAACSVSPVRLRRRSEEVTGRSFRCTEGYVRAEEEARAPWHAAVGRAVRDVSEYVRKLLGWDDTHRDDPDNPYRSPKS